MKRRRSPSLVHLATLLSVWVSLRLVVAGPFSSNLPPPAATGSAGAPSVLGQLAVDRPLVANQADNEPATSPPARREQLATNIAPQLQKTLAERSAGLPAANQADSAIDTRDAIAKQAPQVQTPGSVLAGPSRREGEASPTVGPRKFSLSGFALIRSGRGREGIAPNGQLGGSQAGLRLQRALVRSSRFSLSANGRLSVPLGSRVGKEAGLGLALRRSGRVPVELLVERRIGLDKGGRDAFAALVAGGFDDFRLPGNVRLSGYAQAGVVGLTRRDGFVDGAVRMEHDLVTIGSTPIRVGAVVAGAKQPRVSRLDIGPSVAARFRLSGASVRLSAEWRERVSGNARPGSGPAITFGLDY